MNHPTPPDRGRDGREARDSGDPLELALRALPLPGAAGGARDDGNAFTAGVLHAIARERAADPLAVPYAVAPIAPTAPPAVQVRAADLLPRAQAARERLRHRRRWMAASTGAGAVVGLLLTLWLAPGAATLSADALDPARPTFAALAVAGLLAWTVLRGGLR